MTLEQETVERLAVENETLAQELRRLGGDDADAAVATAGWNEWVATVLRALLAERDAALAEVARLSSPPDDAEVEAAHREWFATTYPHTYADVQSDYEALDAFVTSEEAWAAATRATLAKHGGK